MFFYLGESIPLIIEKIRRKKHKHRVASVLVKGETNHEKAYDRIGSDEWIGDHSCSDAITCPPPHK